MSLTSEYSSRQQPPSASLTPVSYTHLDVYKRQVGVPPGRDRARAACPRGVSGRDQHHAERSGGDLSGHHLFFVIFVDISKNIAWIEI